MAFFYYKGFGWHAFRRQNVTFRLEAMKQARHSSVDMTLLYTLTDAERERQPIDAMFADLKGI